MKGLKVFVLLAAVAVTVPLFGAVDAFLKIDGIKGESQDSKHANWIELMSFSWSMGNTTAANRATAPTCASHEAKFTLKGMAAPQLMKAAVAHQPLQGVVIDFRGQSHVLQNAFVSSCQNNLMGDGSSTTCTLNFTRCTTHGGGVNTAAAPSVSETNGKLLLGNNPAEAVHLLGLRSQGLNGLIILQRGASPSLMKACATGKHYPAVTITCRKAGGTQQEYYTVKLEDAVISSVQRNADGSTALTLNFGKMQGSIAGLESLQ
jgi:type VI protein secretion system component Hcp